MIFNKKGENCMGYFAYHRVSSTGQKLDRGIDEITRYCEEHNITLDRPIFTDKMTGKTFDRPRYTVMKEDVLRQGDFLLITEVDRLGREKCKIVEELLYYKNKGIRVLILELPTTLIEVNVESELNKLIIETIMNMIIELYACLAEGELRKKNKRQAEGLVALKLRGQWDTYGRPHAIEWNKFKLLYERVLRGEVKPFEAIKQLNVSMPTYYRYKRKYEQEVGLKV